MLGRTTNTTCTFGKMSNVRKNNKYKVYVWKKCFQSVSQRRNGSFKYLVIAIERRIIQTLGNCARLYQEQKAEEGHENT